MHRRRSAAVAAIRDRPFPSLPRSPKERSDAYRWRKRLNLDAYLARIGLAAAPAADAAGLETLQRAHRLAIAFENLDIPLGRGIKLDPQSVFDKLVTHRRGGYCFEQNQLFLRALEALGFQARPLLARVWLGLQASDTPPRTHTLNLVTLVDEAGGGREWIADAGFGGSYTPPMPLSDGAEVATADGAAHRLRADDDHGWMLERRGAADGDWTPQYSFTTDPVWAMDLVMANHYTATAYQTRFTSFVVASIATEEGFASLLDRRLSQDGGADEIADAGAWREALAGTFGIHLTADEVKALKLYEA